MIVPRLILSSAAVLLVAACSGNSSSDTGEPPPQTGAIATGSSPTSRPYDAEPYCDLIQQLEAAGEKAFAKLGQKATPAQYRAAERNFVLGSQDLLGGLVGAAPSHLTDELDTFLAAMRQRGGLEDSGVSQREATAAEKRILAFEKRHC